MKRGIRYLKLYLMLLTFALAADYAMALPGPFEFSFATPFLTNIVLLPFQLGGCF